MYLKNVAMPLLVIFCAFAIELEAAAGAGSTPSSSESGIGAALRSVLGGAPPAPETSPAPSGSAEAREPLLEVATESSGRLTGPPPLPPGHFRYHFRVPVKIRNAPEGSLIMVECGVYKKGYDTFGGLPVARPADPSRRIAEVPLDAQGNHEGVINVLADFTLQDIELIRPYRYMCRLNGIRRAPDGTRYGTSGSSYESSARTERERVGNVPLSVCSEFVSFLQYRSGRGNTPPTNATPLNYTAAPGTRCVGWTDGSLEGPPQPTR